jgi:hypothetical protein
MIFQSYRDNAWEIYIADGDGGGQTRLTYNSADDGDATLQRGGARIAFDSNRDGIANHNYEIYSMNADGTNVQRLTNNTAVDYRPVWSPDGTRIAFESYRDGNWEIYVMNANGTGQTRLTNNANADRNPTWSPDGSRMTWARRYTMNNVSVGEVWVMNANGSGQVRIAGPIAYLDHPVWSPDGSRIAFDADDTTNADPWNILYTVNPDGSNLRAVNTWYGGYNDSWMSAWSPDSQWLMYTRLNYVEQNGQLYVDSTYIERVKTDGSSAQSLPGSGRDYRPDWQSIDLAAPAMTTSSMPRWTRTTSLQISWQGNDVGVSGVHWVETQYRDGPSGSWTTLVTMPDPQPATVYNWTGVLDGHTYYFRSRGIDYAGNIQPFTTAVDGDTYTTIDVSGPVITTLVAPTLTNQRQFIVSWSATDATSGVAEYDVDAQPSGSALSHWVTSSASTSAMYQAPAGVTGVCFTASATDVAGNTGTPHSFCTTIDDVAPSTTTSVPAQATAPSFLVSWHGTDATSGIATYDVQRKVGSGAWTNWLTATTETSGWFSGQLSTTYSFRARATDRAGNVEAYAGAGVTTTTPLLAVSGDVQDNLGRPVAVASVNAQPSALNTLRTGLDGKFTLYFNATGYYTFTASQTRFGNLPPIKNVQVTGATAPLSFVLPPPTDVISNGQFETGDLTGWTLGGDTLPELTAGAHTGDGAVRLGGTFTLPTTTVKSLVAISLTSRLEQDVVLPSPVLVSPTLSLLYLVSAAQPSDTLSVVLTDGATAITYTLPVTASGWQHTWEPLPDWITQTAILRLQWAQDAPDHVADVVVDEVSLGSSVAGLGPLYLPVVSR